MKKLTGIEVTEALMALKNREGLGYEVEVEVEINEEDHAKGDITFMNVGWEYEFVGVVLRLTLNDAETHFDHVLGMTVEEIAIEEDNIQVEMEGLIEIGTVVTIR